MLAPRHIAAPILEFRIQPLPLRLALEAKLGFRKQGAEIRLRRLDDSSPLQCGTEPRQSLASIRLRRMQIPLSRPHSVSRLQNPDATGKPILEFDQRWHLQPGRRHDVNSLCDLGVDAAKSARSALPELLRTGEIGLRHGQGLPALMQPRQVGHVRDPPGTDDVVMTQSFLEDIR